MLVDRYHLAKRIQAGHGEVICISWERRHLPSRQHPMFTLALTLTFTQVLLGRGFLSTDALPLQVDVGKNGHITYTEFIAATLVRKISLSI